MVEGRGRCLLTDRLFDSPARAIRVVVKHELSRLTALSLSLSMTVISLVFALFRSMRPPRWELVQLWLPWSCWMGLPPALLARLLELKEGTAIAVALLAWSQRNWVSSLPD